jgi:hypothetical protein
MRGLEDALARIARRDELRERANGVRGGAHRVDDSDEPATPSVSPVVDEVTEALQDVVRRNPGVFATVVVQEADTAWSVWIGEWDGTLRTRVTRLDSDPPAVTGSETPYTLDAAATPVGEPAHEPTEMPFVPAPAQAPAPVPIPATAAGTVPAPRRPADDSDDDAPSAPTVPDLRPLRAARPAAETRPMRATSPYTMPEPPPATYQPTMTAPPPLRAVNGPAMNDRVAGRIAELLRREAAREAARESRDPRGIDA